jgi:hypothetical protein
VNSEEINPTLEENYPTTLKYQPFRDEDWRVVEEQSDYIHRMRLTLPNWPEELLQEWLYRHACCMERYAFLDFARFEFTQEVWTLACVPGLEAFNVEKFCDDFQNIEERAEKNTRDWLAHYMLRVGTWNTPIVLLDNSDQYHFPTGEPLKYPYHLLEGHRRLSFLNGLRNLNKALPQHIVWIAKINI